MEVFSRSQTGVCEYILFSILQNKRRKKYKTDDVRKSHKQKKKKTISQRRYQGGSKTKVQDISIFVAATFSSVFEFLECIISSMRRIHSNNYSELTKSFIVSRFVFICLNAKHSLILTQNRISQYTIHMHINLKTNCWKSFFSEQVKSKGIITEPQDYQLHILFKRVSAFPLPVIRTVDDKGNTDHAVKSLMSVKIGF